MMENKPQTLFELTTPNYEPGLVDEQLDANPIV